MVDSTTSPSLGDISRRDLLGLKGRGRVIYAACPECGRERWVPLKCPEQLCKSCSGKEQRRALDLNQAAHKSDCKCYRCRLGKGYFKGENNPSWKGGKQTLSDGYVAVMVKPDDKFYGMAWKRSKGGSDYVLEHRLVMARSLGRPLEKHETVHHKNGIRSDNRIDNLELWASNHVPGQRVSEAMCPHCGNYLGAALDVADSGLKRKGKAE